MNYYLSVVPSLINISFQFQFYIFYMVQDQISVIWQNEVKKDVNDEKLHMFHHIQYLDENYVVSKHFMVNI